MKYHEVIVLRVACPTVGVSSQGQKEVLLPILWLVSQLADLVRLLPAVAQVCLEGFGQ